MSFYRHRRETERLDARWRSCYRCGSSYTQNEILFKKGSVAATVGETLTGQTSGKTATVESVVLAGGAYASGNASGTVVVTSPSGDFTVGELIDGSTGGSTMFTCAVYRDTRNGFVYPETQLAEYEGKEYCLEHYAALMQRQIDRYKPDINDI